MDLTPFEVVGRLVYDQHRDQLLDYGASRVAFERLQNVKRDRALKTLKRAYWNDQVSSEHTGLYLTLAVMFGQLARDRVRHEFGGF